MNMMKKRTCLRGHKGIKDGIAGPVNYQLVNGECEFNISIQVVPDVETKSEIILSFTVPDEAVDGEALVLVKCGNDAFGTTIASVKFQGQQVVLYPEVRPSENVSIYVDGTYKLLMPNSIAV